MTRIAAACWLTARAGEIVGCIVFGARKNGRCFSHVCCDRLPLWRNFAHAHEVLLYSAGGLSAAVTADQRRVASASVFNEHIMVVEPADRCR